MITKFDLRHFESAVQQLIDTNFAGPSAKLKRNKLVMIYFLIPNENKTLRLL